ncbi:MAG: nitrous oxide-stimulated promoter family protein [Candidatus Neomarinimicrobiota bacterium]
MELSRRIEREKRTIGVMIKMYCDHNHNINDSICDDCNDLIEFANEKIDRCIFQQDKPVCSECRVHCYRMDMRDKIKTVMRFAGPKMMIQHPIMGIRHMIDKRRFKYVDIKLYKSTKNNI